MLLTFLVISLSTDGRSGPFQGAEQVTPVTERPLRQKYHITMAPIPEKRTPVPAASSRQVPRIHSAGSASLTPPMPVDSFTSGDSLDPDIHQFRRLAQRGGYSNYRGLNSESVPVYRDEASSALPKGWRKETQSDGVNAYSNGNIELKVTLHPRKRRVKSRPPAPKPKPKPQAQNKPRPKESPGPTGTVTSSSAPTRPQKAAPVKEATTQKTEEIYIHPYIKENADLIKKAAERHGIPPEMLGATIATELRGGESARQYQKEKNIPAAIWNIAKGEGIGSTSLGPGQVSVDASLKAGVKSTPGKEFLRLHLSETYAVDRAGAYLKHLFVENYSARSTDKTLVQPLHYSDRDWARVISGYNTGDATTAKGTYDDQLYREEQYSLDIQKRIKACRKIFEE